MYYIKYLYCPFFLKVFFVAQICTNVCRRADCSHDVVITVRRDATYGDQRYERDDDDVGASGPGLLPAQQYRQRSAVVQQLPRRNARLHRRWTGRQHPERSRLLVCSAAFLLVQRLPADARRLRQLLPHRVAIYSRHTSRARRLIDVSLYPLSHHLVHNFTN